MRRRRRKEKVRETRRLRLRLRLRRGDMQRASGFGRRQTADGNNNAASASARRP